MSTAIKLKGVQFKVPPDWFTRLKVATAKKGTNPSALSRKLCMRWLKTHEEKEGVGQ